MVFVRAYCSERLPDNSQTCIDIRITGCACGDTAPLIELYERIVNRHISAYFDLIYAFPQIGPLDRQARKDRQQA